MKQPTYKVIFKKTLTEEEKEFFFTEQEVKDFTTKLVAEGTYVKQISKWNPYQYRYVWIGVEKENKFYSTKESGRNFAKMNLI